MILLLTAIDKTSQVREFCCQLTEIEEALELLTSISIQGDQLLRAHIVDGKSHLKLPVDVIDGQSFRTPMRQLEEQWQALLSEPVYTASSITNWRIDFTRQRIKLYDDRIAQIKHSIDHVDQLCRRTERMVHYDSLRTEFINRYRLMLDTYNQQMIQAQMSRQRILEKLK